MEDFYEMTPEQIRDSTLLDVTNKNIGLVLEAFEEQYDQLPEMDEMDEDGNWISYPHPDELETLQEKIIDALELLEETK